MKKTLLALAAAATLAFGTIAAHAEDKVIKLGTMSWEGLYPVSMVLKKALEDRGFTVEVTKFSEWGIAYAALTGGSVELLASQVDFVTSDYWNKNKNRLEKVGIVSHGLFDGLAVPDYVDIDSIDQLNDNIDMFGGKIIGIEPGSGIMREAKEIVDAYDLKYTLVEGSTAGMSGGLKAAIDRKEPILVTMWKPTWMAQKYNMKFLKDPKGIFPPPQSFHLIAEKGFAADHPEAREIISGVFLPVDDIAAINTAVVDGMDMDQAIQAWIDDHASLITRWNNIKKY